MKTLVQCGSAVAIATCLWSVSGCGDSAKSTPDAGPVGEVVGLRVSDASARSCEVALQDPDRAVRRLVFGAGVEGRSVREGERLASAFVAKADSALLNADLGLELVPSGSAAKVTVQLSHCFDRAGQPLPSATVEVVR